MKLRIKLISLLVVALGILSMALPTAVHAQELRSSENVVVGKNDTINTSLAINGTTINIEGTVDGDLYCFGSQIVISGRILGDVFCAGQSISISGQIEGSARLIASDINISGLVKGSGMIAASKLILTDKASIGKDLTIAAESARLNGSVARDMVVYAGDTSLNGYVGRNVSGQISQLTLESNTDVRGNIRYSGQNNPIRLSGSKVSGEIVRTPIMSTTSYGSGIVPAILSFLVFMASLLLVSLATIWAFPKFYINTTKQIESGLGKTSLFGLANIFLVPIVAFVLLLTIIGAPLSGLIIVAWILSLLLSGPVFAYYIGTKIFKKSKNSKNQVLVMFVGSLVILGLYAIPVVNFIVGVTVGIVGSGAIMAHFKYSNSKSKKA